tara:strand:- start:5860 stop:6105 length:246 start_codon:yes stop_codon:yes gene_type:complete
MACKSCKKTKEMKEEFDGGIASLQAKINRRKREVELERIHNNIDPSEFRVKLGERIIVTLLAWIPMGVGYFTIIKWMISLF